MKIWVRDRIYWQNIFKAEAIKGMTDQMAAPIMKENYPKLYNKVQKHRKKLLQKRRALLKDAKKYGGES